MAKKKIRQAGATAPQKSALPEVPDVPVVVTGRLKIFLRIVVGLGVIFLLWSFTQSMAVDESTRTLAAAGWGQVAGVIARNKVAAIAHGAVMILLAGGGLWLLLSRLIRRSGRAPMVAFGLVAAVAIDALMLSGHYVKSMSASGLKENDVIKILKQSIPERRVALASQEGFYNYWLTYLFPYYGIKTVNVTQMPRMPDDYKAFLGAVGRNPMRLWELSAVEFILGPAQVWSQLQRDPAMKDAVQLVFAYNVVPIDDGYDVVPATAERPGQHVVIRLNKPAPRFALISGWEKADDQDALSKLASPAWQPYQHVLVAPASADGLAAMADSGITGSVQLEEYRGGYMKLKLNAGQAAILRVSEKYDENWKVSVDGKPDVLRRVDYIFQGVAVPPGIHEVVLSFSPSVWPFFIQVAAMVLCAAAAAGYILQRKKAPADPDTPVALAA